MKKDGSAYIALYCVFISLECLELQDLVCPPDTILLHSMEQGPSWEANIFSACQESPSFYGTRRFITAFTSASHLSLSWARSIPSMPHPISWMSILIICSHLRLDLPRNFCPSDLLTKTLYARLLFPLLATYPTNFIFDLITQIISGKEYRL